MNGTRIGICLVWVCAVGLAGANGAENKAPVIRHEPVTVALEGQSIAIKASVTDDLGVKAVTLHYSTSKDVAPFKLEMQPVGQETYLCTLPANLLSRAAQVTYYIEAMDDMDLSAETPWYPVSVQVPRAGSGGAAKAPLAPAEEESSWTTPALIAGGILVVGGVAAAVIANNSSGDDGGSGSTTNPPPDPSEDYSGAYVGSVTTSLQFPGQTATTESHGTTIVIASDGSVTSADLYEGQALQGRMSGANVSLEATVSVSNITGRITYSGTVVNGRITGSVGGTATTSAGTNGTYYGTFYAVKQ